METKSLTRITPVSERKGKTKSSHSYVGWGASGINELQMIRKIGKELMEVVSEVPTETVKMSRLLEKNGIFYTSDIFLPQGCSALRMPQSTVIEIKKKALFDTISQQQKKYEALGGDKGKIKRYILAIDTCDEYAKIIKPKSSGKSLVGFEVTSVMALSEKIRKASEKSKLNKSVVMRGPLKG